VKIGLFGGTFNPVHTGHLIIAEMVRGHYNLDKVIFIPAKIQPQKGTKGVAGADHRINMINYAIKGNPDFSSSDIELKRVGPSYTIDTLTILKKNFGDAASFYFIIGADAFAEIDLWKNYREIACLCRLIVVSREGSAVDPGKLKLFEERISEMKIKGIGISSTDIRARLKAGRTVRYLLPAKVMEYIVKNGLYGACR